MENSSDQTTELLEAILAELRQIKTMMLLELPEGRPSMEAVKILEPVVGERPFRLRYKTRHEIFSRLSTRLDGVAACECKPGKADVAD